MHGKEIELLGGPADGQRIEIPDEVTTPPQTVELQEMPLQALRGLLTQEDVVGDLPAEVRSALAEVGDDEPAPVRCVVYRLDCRSVVSEGEPWRYLYEEASAS